MAEMWRVRLGIRQRSLLLIGFGVGLGAVFVAVFLLWFTLKAPDVAWALLLPILSGIMTALTWAAIVVGYTHLRDRWLGSKIRETISHIGIWDGVAGHGLVLTNRTHISLTVRSVEALLSATQDHGSVGAGQVDVSCDLHYFGDSQTPGELDRNGNWIERAPLPQSDVRGFVQLPPYTEGSWGLLEDSLKDIGKYHKYEKFCGCRITVEFLTLLRTPRVIEVCLNDKMSSGLSTSLNKAAGLGGQT